MIFSHPADSVEWLTPSAMSVLIEVVVVGLAHHASEIPNHVRRNFTHHQTFRVNLARWAGFGGTHGGERVLQAAAFASLG